MRYEPLSILIRSAALCLAVLVTTGCVTSGTGVKPGESTVEDAAVIEAHGQLEQCDMNLERLRQNNALLIETNSKLTSQLEAGKLDQVVESGDYRVRLSECEFRVRELEESVAERDGRIQVMESEIEDYSSDLRAALEECRIQQERAQAEDFSRRLGEEKHVLLYDEFAVEFASELDAGTVSLSRSDGKVIFTIQNKLLFRPGAVRITGKGKSVAKRVAGIIKNLRDWTVTVGAHTDSSKPGKALAKTYPTNWEMSLARANAVVRHLAERESIAPSILSAAGYGEFRPVADNESREGRQMNLRIEFVFEQNEQAPAED
jgi:chemotaxis protein MotB